MRWIRITLATFAILVTTAATAFAFDGNRKGFILAGGIGGGLGTFTQDLTIDPSPKVSSDRENTFAFATTFRIGGGFNEQVMLYYTSNVSWFSLENVLGETVTIATGTGGAGVSYYLSPGAKASYLLGFVGISSWSTPFEDSGDTWYGFGIGAGYGFEFSTHWSLEAMVYYGNPSLEETGIEVQSNVISVVATINGTAY